MADVITRTVDLGIVTAYAEAVEAGYTGTEEEFAEGLRKSALYADNAQASATEAERQAGLASDSATEASGYASDAEGYKDSASGYADDASGYASDAQGYAQDAQASAEQAEQTLNSYAKVDGFYEEMTVGSAEQLLSSVYLTDKAPYNFRPSGGANEIGDRETDCLTGGSLPWNQLVQNGNFESVTGWYVNRGTISASNNKLTFTASSNASSSSSLYQNTAGVAHKILIMFKATASVNTRIRTRVFGSYGVNVSATANTKLKYESIINANGNDGYVYAYPNYGGVMVEGDTCIFEDFQVFDLTAMFGSTIADYIYTLELAQAGTGIAKLKSWGFFLKDYYAYSEPTFKHVDGLTSHKMVGFNQWDEEWEVGQYSSSTGAKEPANDRIRSKNYIPCIPNTQYYFNLDKQYRVFWYDADKNFLSFENFPQYTPYAKVYQSPSNAHYMTFNTSGAYGTTYNHDICINFHYDGERDGEYEPYTVHSYALDDVTLRGIPKLDTDNNLYYDGDTYESDGTVTRNTILRAYQEGDESLANAITDGTNTVVYSANNAIETADPYTNPQIVDNWGTEEYIGSEIPVGHSTKYPPDLKAKVEVAPNAPTSDGLYLMKRENGENAYIAYVSPIPSVSEDGTFVLKATKSGGATTLSWVSE